MTKNKVYKVNNIKDDYKINLIEFIVNIIIYAVILIMANNIFKGMYVENFLYALIASLIISLLNYFIKPILIFFTLPLNVLTMGITYPLVNVIILKICGWFLGDKFSISGIISAFFIAIFISFMKILFESLFKNNLGGRD